MANARLKSLREAYRRDKTRNPFGLYTESYGEWIVDIPKNAATALIGNDEIQKMTKAETVSYTEIGYLVKFIVNGDNFTEILKLLKSQNVKGKYCINDPYYTWKNLG